jgi:hypothetical protein
VIEQWQAEEFYPLGFLVAGYDDDGIGRIHEVAAPGPLVEVAAGIETASRGFVYRGQIEVVRRLFEGIDRTELQRAGVEIPNELTDPIAQLNYNILFPVTLQDAVDLAMFIIRTTIDVQRFTDGTLGRQTDLPGCGGPIRVLAIRRGEVEWVVDPPLATSAPGIAEGGAAV